MGRNQSREGIGTRLGFDFLVVITVEQLTNRMSMLYRLVTTCTRQRRSVAVTIVMLTVGVT
jgi:hypothetical protein